MTQSIKGLFQKTISAAPGMLLLGVLCLAAACSPLGEVRAPAQDGKIAFSSAKDGNWDIWVLEGGEPLQVTKTPFDERFPAWSPGGDEIVYRTDVGDLRALSLAAGSQPSTLLDGPGLGSPSFSSDGEWILFEKFRSDILNDSDVWMIPAHGGEAVRVIAETGIQQYPDWSPDRAAILYTNCSDGDVHDIYLYAIEGKRRERLTERKGFAIHGVFSPEGERIAYTSDDTGDFEIWMKDIGETDPMQLTRTPGYDGHPTWSPDGTAIAFESNRSGTLQIWSIELADLSVRQVTDMDGGCRDPHWYRGK